jgi:hypothetical protein
VSVLALGIANNCFAKGTIGNREVGPHVYRSNVITPLSGLKNIDIREYQTKKLRLL